MTPLVITNYTFIDDVIPINEVTLLVGLPGSGKTYSLIKFLNANKIVPIHVNLDRSPTGNLKALPYGEEVVTACLVTDEISGLKDRVIIFDHYSRVDEFLDWGEDKKGKDRLAKAFEDLAHNHKCTVIVIAHPEDYVGKDGVFKDNKTLARNCAEYMYIDSIQPRGKTGTTASIVHKLHIRKGRGSGGDRIIDNWMRP